MTKIVHCKNPHSLYVGRPKAGQEWGFGNPFVIGRDGDRPTVIDKMDQWLETRKSFSNKNATPERRQWILDNIHLIRDAETIGCWCNYPKEDCHGRILIERANKNVDKKIRCIIAGSRTITDYGLICAAIKESGFNIFEVVSGKAKGVDSMGERWAKENGILTKEFPAKWNDLTHPKALLKRNSQGKLYDARAGFRRNQDMADYATHLIAITTGSSGTEDMIERAKKENLTIFIKRV